MSLVGARPQMEVDFLKYSISVQKIIYNTKPGLTGIGSIIFRDEEDIISKANDPHVFYKEKIAPYKCALENWYQNNISFLTDVKLLFLTVWVVIFPKSNISHRWFSNLPKKTL